MNFITFSCIFVLLPSTLIRGQISFLDNPRNIEVFRTLKEIAMMVFGTTGDDDQSEFHREGRFQRRVQRRIPINVPFPCNVTAGRSRNVPISVHYLRPGDIDVIGAMGDSLTAGTGIFASSVFHMVIENRGVTALGGGQATWREYVTLPNIIKEFNPNLIGYSSVDSSTYLKASAFNVAEVAAMSRDLPFMARNLIQRMKNHPDVDFKNHWKLISILIGPNDFCSEMCWISDSPSTMLLKHKNDLIETMRIFRDNSPRTLISIILPPNLTLLGRLREKPFFCQIATDIECSCLTGPSFRYRDDEFAETISAWQRIDEEIASYTEFQTEEFAVVVQPFATNLTIPMRPDGTADWRYLSVDCFHMSQIANARASRALWKNMLQPVGQKSHDWEDSDSIACPSESRPYIMTPINSPEEFQ